MTTFQIVAIAILVASVAWQYMPAIAWPKRKPNVMKQIEAVIRIRDQATSPAVTTACNDLLQALLR